MLYNVRGYLLIHHQCAIHMDDATAHSAPERPPHTSLLVERRQSDEPNQQIYLHFTTDYILYNWVCDE